jgi:CubicO group peptidase (beta-lactamase class C family)
MRHLLTHTCGWQGDYFEDLGRGEGALVRMVDRTGDLPQITPIGEVWSYNNSAFSLAGRVIELVTGKSYEEALKDLVLDPLDLSPSYFFAEDVLTHRFAVGHNTRADGEMILEHPDGTNGQASTLCLVPQKGFAMVLMVNSDRGRRLVERVKLAALLEYTGFQLPQAVLVKVEPKKLVEYVGCYSATLQILDVKVAGDSSS